MIDKRDNYKRNLKFLEDLLNAKEIEEIKTALDTFNDTEVKFKNIKTRNLKELRNSKKEKLESEKGRELEKDEIKV